MREINKLTPEYFYADVAKKTGVDIKIVRSVYTNYLKRVQECIKTEDKIIMKGLGTFEISQNKVVRQFYKFDLYLNKHPERFITHITKKEEAWYKSLSSMYKQVLKLNRKYEYIEECFKKLRLNTRRIEELFDHEGNCRRDFSIQDGDMQDVPPVLEEQGGICDSED